MRHGTQAKTRKNFHWGKIPFLQISGTKIFLDWTLVLFLPLMLLTLRLRLFPFHYVALSTATYWWMAILLTLGFGLSLMGRELVHLAIGKIIGEAPSEMVLYLFGTGSPIKVSNQGYWQQRLVDFGPIAFNLLLSGLLFSACLFFSAQGFAILVTGVLLHLSAANFTLAMFQLLPVLPLDGGRFLLDHFSKQGTIPPKTLRSLFYLGHFVVFLLILFGLYQVLSARPAIGSWITLVALMLGIAHSNEYEFLKPQMRADR